MIDLSTKLANAAIGWENQASRLDAQAAFDRGRAEQSARQAEALKASMTPVQRNSPSYRRSDAALTEGNQRAWQAKVDASLAKAAAHRERAEYARRGLLYISRSDTRDTAFMNENAALFRECRGAGRVVWQGEGTGSGVTAPNGQPAG